MNMVPKSSLLRKQVHNFSNILGLIRYQVAETQTSLNKGEFISGIPGHHMKFEQPINANGKSIAKTSETTESRDLNSSRNWSYFCR